MAFEDERAIDERSADLARAAHAGRLLQIVAVLTLMAAVCGLGYVWLIYTP